MYAIWGNLRVTVQCFTADIVNLDIDGRVAGVGWCEKRFARATWEQTFLLPSRVVTSRHLASSTFHQLPNNTSASTSPACPCSPLYLPNGCQPPLQGLLPGGA